MNPSVATRPQKALERGSYQKPKSEPLKSNAPQEDTCSFAEHCRHLLAELFGTFMLTFVAAGGEVIAAISHGEVSHVARVVAPGLVVMALIYAIGDASGAHFNPAVTFAFSARGAFPWKRLPAYWIAQVTGASFAAFLLHALYGSVKHLGANEVHYSVHAAFVMEIVLTCFLVTVILGTATRYSVVGPNAAVAVGGTIALCGLFASPISGASMNPARSLGPALVSGHMTDIWIYLIGPLIGSALAVLLMTFLHVQKDPEEGEAAKGDEDKKPKP